MKLKILTNIVPMIIVSINSLEINKYYIENKRKLLEKDVKNIKIVDYFSESRKLNNPK